MGGWDWCSREGLYCLLIVFWNYHSFISIRKAKRVQEPRHEYLRCPWLGNIYQRSVGGERRCCCHCKMLCNCILRVHVRSMICCHKTQQVFPCLCEKNQLEILQWMKRLCAGNLVTAPGYCFGEKNRLVHSNPNQSLVIICPGRMVSIKPWGTEWTCSLYHLLSSVPSLLGINAIGLDCR